LLDLLHTELAHRRVSASSLCIASGVPPSTGLRWLKSLEQQGLVVRKFDERDARRIFGELSAETSKALRRYFVDIVEPRRADER
jgi:DNA-binding MarR family transcriptional regulator